MTDERDKKFYFYEVSGKKEERQVDLADYLKDIDWISAAKNFPIPSKSNAINEVIVESLYKDYYYGRIFKSKSKIEFYEKDMGTTPDELESAAEYVGEKDTGIVNFVFTPQNKIRYY